MTRQFPLIATPPNMAEILTDGKRANLKPGMYESTAHSKRIFISLGTAVTAIVNIPLQIRFEIRFIYSRLVQQ